MVHWMLTGLGFFSLDLNQTVNLFNVEVQKMDDMKSEVREILDGCKGMLKH